MKKELNQKKAKVWKQAAVDALYEFARRVGYPDLLKITPETAAEHRKRVLAFAQTAPANIHQKRQIKAHGLHPNPDQLTFYEARAILSDYFRRKAQGKRGKAKAKTSKRKAA